MERFNSFSSDQIVLTKRQASMIMASMLLFCLFVFIVGFFLGKRTTMEDFSTQVTKEALHDQIDFLLTTQSLQSSQEDITAIIDAEPQDHPFVIADTSFDTPQAIVTAEIVQPQEIVAPIILSQERVSTARDVHENNMPKQQLVVEEKIGLDNLTMSLNDNNPQYAQLIGFGTKKAAQLFVARLKKHGVSVILKTMMSKTASGKQRVWYQAITPTYDSAQELQNQLTKIKRLEHIRDKDMKIVHVK